MTTSNSPTTTSTDPQDAPAGTREPLRFRLAAYSGRNTLDGGWWPQSRDLPLELADLVAGFPAADGRVVRAVVSPPDWDPAPRRIPVGTGYVKVGSFPRDDTHLIYLRTLGPHVLRVLVVPPDFSRAQGEEALLAASTAGNSHSAAELLREVTDGSAVDVADEWVDGAKA